LVVNTSPSATHIVPEISEIVDVDSFEVEKSLQQPKRLATQCNGYSLIFPDGKSPHTAYPFALHDTQNLPWDYTIQSGKMSLFSQGCTGMTDEARPCQHCQQLRTNQVLEKIVSQLENGIHENTQFAYYGFSGLHELLLRKNQRLEFYRLRGLNQARQLLGKAVALSENKRLLMAIASGKTQRVDQVITIGLRQKKRE